MSSTRLAALLALLLLLLQLGAAPPPPQDHLNPLDSFRVAQLSTALDADVHISVSPTPLRSALRSVVESQLARNPSPPPARSGLQVNATALEHTGQWVSVYWSGVPFPSYDDYIALYPAGADPAESVPIKFKRASVSATHLSLGAGATT